MNMAADLPGLQMSAGTIATAAVNFRPSTWPPADDYPVVVDAQDVVVSRYSDPTWQLWPWAGRSLSIGFGDGKANRGAKISRQNAGLLRQVAAWWLWGPNAIQSPHTLIWRHTLIKPVFVVCSEERILASDLWRHPKVVEQIVGRLPKSQGSRLFTLLHELWTARDRLGFVLLDDAGLKQLAGLLSAYEFSQTAYIPPRIWTYQLLRLRQCLEEYLAHQDKIEDCYRFCLSAYATNAGGLAGAFYRSRPHDRPFASSMAVGHVIGERRYYGRFRLTAERFGIDALLDRWVDFRNQTGITAFSTYLNLVSLAGLAYTLNFSLMRVDEGARLRVGCYSTESDAQLGSEIHMLSGVTTKTIQDSDARWIVSPSVKVSIDAMTSIAKLRMSAAQHDPRLNLDPVDVDRPMFQCRPYEPWSQAGGKTRKVRKSPTYYANVVETYSKLFDIEQLRITKADLNLARSMTFGLDPEVFAVGKVWPLAWHQLRRTGACNMLSTGLVSEAALQLQLKHASRAMSRYYGQNHYKLKSRFDPDAQGYYLREMYKAVVREFSALRDDRFVSPHSAKRKAQILLPIAEKDHVSLVKGARNGAISYRPTLLGGCAKPGNPCPLGGISNISGCMGHDSENACEWAFIDRDKRPAIENLCQLFRTQLRQAPAGSPLEGSLKAQLESAERALHVLDTV